MGSHPRTGLGVGSQPCSQILDQVGRDKLGFHPRGRLGQAPSLACKYQTRLEERNRGFTPEVGSGRLLVLLANIRPGWKRQTGVSPQGQARVGSQPCSQILNQVGRDKPGFHPRGRLGQAPSLDRKYQTRLEETNRGFTLGVGLGRLLALLANIRLDWKRQILQEEDN